MSAADYVRGHADGVALAVSVVARLAAKLRTTETESPAQRARVIDLLEVVADEIDMGARRAREPQLTAAP